MITDDWGKALKAATALNDDYNKAYNDKRKPQILMIYAIEFTQCGRMLYGVAFKPNNK